ncbi:MAG TPA: AbrB/MazE/SpoVT family DNA-binding domain-containing protein [Candidatus Yonathbacteria bacterium]|nr:AbrB/MazE/SpoVT family DNA-binding domain-containing protein [Candidatus Yonathbacteria bacterium]
MARKKLEERNIRKLTKTGGNTYYVTLPIEAIRSLGWKKSQKLVVEVDERRERIVIKDWEPKSKKK